MAASCNETGGDDGRADTENGDIASISSGQSVRWFVRPMRHEDIDRCLKIWLQVELTEARVTVANVLTIDPAGLYVAELESNGEVIGMCSGVMVRHDTAFMGFYAVAPEYQGLGIGRELWARTMARLDESTINIGLYGVPSMSAKYKRSGFKVEDTIRMLIFESAPGEQLQTSQLKCLKDLHCADVEENPVSSGECSRSFDLVVGGEQLCNETMISKLIDYDTQVHGHSRERLLRNYLLEADELPLTIALVRRIVQTRDTKTDLSGSGSNGGGGQRRDDCERKSSCCSNGPGRGYVTGEEILSASVKSSLSISEITSQKRDETQTLQLIGGDMVLPGEQFKNNTPAGLVEDTTTYTLLGYGCIRHDNTGGAMIGPLYAKSGSVCEVILRELIERFNLSPGGKYSVMSLTSNERADKLLRQIGLQEMDQCSRMFTKFIPEASLDQIYYVHSPNFTLF